MEHYDVPIILRPEQKDGKALTPIESTDDQFILANTQSVSFDEIHSNHIIPVYVKDNEPLISHADFIQATKDVVEDVYHGEHILKPSVRVSHPIKGRIPEAKDKPASQLQEWEKTLYYERMMFVIEIPTIQDEINGCKLSLTIGGVKAYNQDNLYNRKGADEHFKIFVGFKNQVCTNLCVWTDGYSNDLKIKDVGQLRACIYSLLQRYNANFHLFHLKQLVTYHLSEKEFALVIGRCRMYQHLPPLLKADIPPILFGDQQLGAICRDYFKDAHFSKCSNGQLNLWNMYNLFTGVAKTTYIDSYLDRSVNAFSFIEQLRHGLEKRDSCWYLN